MRRAALLAICLLGSACSSSTATDGPAVSVATTGPAAPSPPTTAVAARERPMVTTSSAAPPTTSSVPPPTTSEAPALDPNPHGIGEAHGAVSGLLMFRGNPTRTWYGTGPLPEEPMQLWRYPESAMCGRTVAGGSSQLWCGTGWTGQPVVWERPDGVTEVIFGAYDRSVHFVDAADGTATRPRFRVGDVVKGSVSLDPDGFPLLYFGARDNKLRVVALDRDEPLELWSRDANESRGIWNNDWDANPVIVDDILYTGGENGFFYAFRLNRSYDVDGLVMVAPELLIEFPAFTNELRGLVGNEHSIESSTVLVDGRAYFATSAGRIVGLGVAASLAGEPSVVFDYWMGEDVDATIVTDADGMLYVAAEQERFTERGIEVGQLIKLDPYATGDPLVWRVSVPPLAGGDGGLWATPALGDGVLYAATHPGELLAVATDTGDVAWRDEIGHHAWSSPVIVDETLIVAIDCNLGGALRGYDVSQPMQPSQRWEVTLASGCIESTPAVWNGRIYVGSRDGYFYAFGAVTSKPTSTAGRVEDSAVGPIE